MRRDSLLTLSLLLLALSLGLYANSLNGAFQFDDATSIIENEAVHRLSPASWWSFWPGRFVSYASLAIDHQLYGRDPRGYHLGNVIVHALAGLACLWLAYGLFRVRRPEWGASTAAVYAAAAAAVFVSHPLQTQAVAYIVQRMASLFTLFYLAALACHVHGLRRDARGEGRGWTPVATMGLALLAMFSKEPAITFPLALVLVDFVARPSGQRRWRRVGPYLPLFALPLLVAWLGGQNFGRGTGSMLSETQGISRFDYLLTQIDVVARYLRLIVLPIGQNIDHHVPWRSHLFEGMLPALLAAHLLLLGAAAWAWKRGHRLLALCPLWFYLTLAPESSLYPIRDPMFEHRLYIAMFGPAVALALALERLGRRAPRVGLTFFLALMLGLGTLTVLRNRVWADPLRLWEDALAKSPGLARPHMAVGWMQGNAGHLEEARRELEAAVALDLDYGMAWNNLGTVAYRQGDAARAAEAFARTAELHPQEAVVWLNLALARRSLQDVAGAEAAFGRCVQLEPDFAAALNQWAALLMAQGRVEEAREKAEKAARLGEPSAGLLEALRKPARPAESDSPK